MQFTEADAVSLLASESQWLVEECLLPPQQKLKLALYRGRKLLAAQEADGAIREFVRAQALARIVHGGQHWRYCRCKVFLAQAYLYLKVSRTKFM